METVAIKKFETREQILETLQKDRELAAVRLCSRYRFGRVPHPAPSQETRSIRSA